MSWFGLRLFLRLFLVLVDADGDGDDGDDVLVEVVVIVGKDPTPDTTAALASIDGCACSIDTCSLVLLLPACGENDVADCGRMTSPIEKEATDTAVLNFMI